MDIHTIREEGPITSVGDFLRLDIIDWSRYRPYWKSPQQAIDIVASWFVRTCSYTVVDVPFDAFPERDDFPRWEHIGKQHYALGKRFWNYFCMTYEGELHFGDMPDFSGKLYGERQDDVHFIVGDIGKTSPMVLKEAALGLGPGKTWISVVNEKTLIFLNAYVKLSHLPRRHISSNDCLIERLTCTEQRPGALRNRDTHESLANAQMIQLENEALALLPEAVRRAYPDGDRYRDPLAVQKGGRSTMEEQVWISHIQSITLEDDWVTVTDLMGRTYRLDPQGAIELAVWIAEHYQDVAQAQVQLQVERRLEETRLYSHLLDTSQMQSKEDPVHPPLPASPPSTPKRQRRSPRKKEET